MKAYISEIKRFAVHDGPGIRTTLFFKGCPLHCLWCHNPEGISYTPQLAYYEHKCIDCGECAVTCPNNAHQYKSGRHLFNRTQCLHCGHCADICPSSALTLFGKEMTVDEILPLLLEDVDFYHTSNGGVTLSGGECLSQPDFCVELLKHLKQYSIHTAVDTCGFVSRDVLERVRPYTDIFLYDVKAFDEDVHIRCTGQSNRPILENLEYLSSVGHPVEIRIPYVPEYNKDQLEKIARFLKPLQNITKIKILPYHNYAGSKYDALGIPNTLPTLLPTAFEIQTAEKIMTLS